MYTYVRTLPQLYAHTYILYVRIHLSSVCTVVYPWCMYVRTHVYVCTYSTHDVRAHIRVACLNCTTGVPVTNDHPRCWWSWSYKTSGLSSQPLLLVWSYHHNDLILSGRHFILKVHKRGVSLKSKYVCTYIISLYSFHMYVRTYVYLLETQVWFVFMGKSTIAPSIWKVMTYL